MKTSITKSLLTSLYQREEINPSLAKRGKGRFFNNDALPMNSLVNIIHKKFSEGIFEDNVQRSYYSDEGEKIYAINL